MFSIDLLKGKGLPRKGDPKRIVMQTVSLLIPVIAVVSLAASYQQGHVQLKTREAIIKQNQLQTELHSAAMKEYSQMNRQIGNHQKVLTDVAKAMSYRIQMTDLLVELTDVLPDPIFVTEMNLDRRVVKEKVKNEETGKSKTFLVVHRVLTLVLCGYESVDGNQAVQDYIVQLKNSEVLSTGFDDFRLAARRQGEINDDSVTYYEIECVFQEQR